MEQPLSLFLSKQKYKNLQEISKIGFITNFLKIILKPLKDNLKK